MGTTQTSLTMYNKNGKKRYDIGEDITMSMALFSKVLTEAEINENKTNKIFVGVDDKDDVVIDIEYIQNRKLSFIFDIEIIEEKIKEIKIIVQEIQKCIDDIESKDAKIKAQEERISNIEAKWSQQEILLNHYKSCDGMKSSYDLGHYFKPIPKYRPIGIDHLEFSRGGWRPTQTSKNTQNSNEEKDKENTKQETSVKTENENEFDASSPYISRIKMPMFVDEEPFTDLFKNFQKKKNNESDLNNTVKDVNKKEISDSLNTWLIHLRTPKVLKEEKETEFNNELKIDDAAKKWIFSWLELMNLSEDEFDKLKRDIENR